MNRWLLLSPWALLFAVTAACSAPVAEDETSSEELIACSGSTCNALATPKPLVRGGVAVFANELYWIGLGSQMATDGRPVEELQHCALPACSTIQRTSLVLKDGTALSAYHLQAALDGVVFWGSKRNGDAGSHLYLSDGKARLDDLYGKGASEWVADEKGFATYIHDGRLDGWARSSVYVCEYVMGGAPKCVSKTDASLNAWHGFALTPTRFVVNGGGRVFSLDRHTLTDAKAEPVYSGESSMSPVFASGEYVMSAMASVYDDKNGNAHHDTVFIRAYTESSKALPGMLEVTASDGKRLYVGTLGEGNVWTHPHTGVVARVGADVSAPRASVLATGQDPRAIAVSDKSVLWIDYSGSLNAFPEPTGTIRFAKK